MCIILPLLEQFKYSKCTHFWVLYWIGVINYFPTFPSWTLILPTTQRNVAGCISQYFIGLLNKLIALYKDFFIFGTVGQKSFTPTFVIELLWRKIIWRYFNSCNPEGIFFSLLCSKWISLTRGILAKVPFSISVILLFPRPSL